MKQYALTNCVIYTGTQVLYDHAVIVNDDKIQDVVKSAEIPTNLTQVDLKGANLTAGFIDLQLNGCGGVMFNDNCSVETLEIMQATNLKSGTTSFLPTFITAPDDEIKHAIAVMREYLANHQHQALGLHLEGPYLSKEKKGVHREEFIREISDEMLAFLLDNADVISKITIAAENATADHIAKFVAKDIVVSIGHSNATSEVANQRFAQGATFATHLHNAMSPVSSGRNMGVVGAVLDNPNVYTGIIVDGLHVNFGNVRIAKQCKQDKLCLVTDATAAAGADIESFQFVGKTVYVRDHKCYDANGTIGGSAVTMIESIQNCVNEVGIALDEAIRMATLYPARAIHLDHQLGSIEKGKIANLTAFNHKFEVLGTAVNGQWQFN
ncbi:N-acetylglucosamine-6-phosphate deacetylase [Gallibacterium salpingitidis]|uniref:N-acetylglucosamine-6-phosphate deacetylase n=1 Tax=Gallibacterium salpingitidis TaxID=505341 RepID=A0A1A7P1G1_9PAST|nr:N-acetylglucosamine-6-phosphate deacetylase [Gallibacterium salpingitidis]OBW95074.1 N-acetylglucosamine-6-phosphate deacetylase [Gallibacterium salpingitidis]